MLGKGLVSLSGRAVTSLTTGRRYAKNVALKIGLARWPSNVLLCEADASARRRKEASVQKAAEKLFWLASTIHTCGTTGEQSCRMYKKAVQQGRSEEAAAYASVR